MWRRRANNASKCSSRVRRAGVVASKTVSEALDIGNLICFDMGGTTAKACVLQAGAAALSSDYFIGGYNEGLAIRIPVLDIKEIGTGGGSIASVDDAGGLHVGPQSAGANPGPACYGGGGTQPTVTDAHLQLGHLVPDRFLAGRMQLDSAAATRAIQTFVATPLGLDVAVAAGGIIAIATAAMANAVRAVTTERGLDPRDFTLVAYGGAGPLHAVDVARELSIATVVIPQAPGTFSAFGMLTADLRREYAQTYRAPLTPDGLRGTAAFFTTLETEARTWLRSAGVPNENTLLEHAVDVRYVGQNYSVTIPLDPGAEHAAVKAAFDAAHQQRYSHSAPEEPAEIVAARVSIVGQLSKPVLAGLPAGTGAPVAGAVLGRRPRAFRPAQRGRRHRLRSRAVAGRRHVRRTGDRPRGWFDDRRSLRRSRRRPAFRSPPSYGECLMSTSDSAHDPITAEIIRNALIAITDEMKTNLMRTAYNPIIYEALDYTVGLFDANGDTVSIGLGAADVHSRPLRCDQGQARVLRPRRDRAGRHPVDQRRIHHGQPPQPHDLYAADLS